MVIGDWAPISEKKLSAKLSCIEHINVENIPHTRIEETLLEDTADDANVVVIYFYGRPTSKRTIDRLATSKCGGLEHH